MVRNKYGAEVVHEAFELLTVHGIVDVDAQRRPHGRAKTSIKKRTWLQITSDASGRPTAFLEKLRVDRDAFESEKRLLIAARGPVV